MMDQHFDRDYQEGRAVLNDGIGALIGRVVNGARLTFDVLHRIHFSAPWTDPRSR